MSFIFDANTEDPKQREMRLRQQQIGSLQQGMGQMPQNVGQGLQAMGDAIRLRALKNQQTAAATDPWTGMRQQTSANPFAQIGNTLTGLFGLGSGGR